MSDFFDFFLAIIILSVLTVVVLAGAQLVQKIENDKKTTECIKMYVDAYYEPALDCCCRQHFHNLTYQYLGCKCL